MTRRFDCFLVPGSMDAFEVGPPLYQHRELTCLMCSLCESDLPGVCLIFLALRCDCLFFYLHCIRLSCCLFVPFRGICLVLWHSFACQVKRAQLQAVEYKRQFGSPMPSRLLTLAMADAAQVRT